MQHRPLPSLLATHAPAAVILIRFVVGGIFLIEGVLKFLYPAALGAGRFAKIGIPAPQVLGPFVGVVEIAGGLLILIGLLTRLAAVLLAVDISVAIFTTKLPILLGHDIAPFHVARLDRYGFLSMAHEARADWSMLLGSVFLLLVGAGAWSIDAWLDKERADRRADGTSFITKS
jgi:putative oxidoreductase